LNFFLLPAVYTAGSQILLLHNAVKSQILPLHFAVGYQIILLLDAGGGVKSMIFAEIYPLHDAERNKISAKKWSRESNLPNTI
jgi:hypothetical protein